MALGDSYATLQQLKAYLQIGDTVDDVELEDALAAASRGIEQYTSRQFNDATSVSPRLFVPDSRDLVPVDDFHATDGLVVEVDAAGDGSFAAWDASAYQLEPLNGTVGGQSGWPYNRIRSLDAEWPCLRRRSWQDGRRRATVRVTARWGWAVVPDPVRQACLILASELFKLRSAPFGVAGFGEYGVVRVRENPKVCALLRPYERYPAMVA